MLLKIKYHAISDKEVEPRLFSFAFPDFFVTPEISSGPAQKCLHNYVFLFVITNNPRMRNEEILFGKPNLLFSLAPFSYS